MPLTLHLITQLYSYCVV